MGRCDWRRYGVCTSGRIFWGLIEKRGNLGRTSERQADENEVETDEKGDHDQGLEPRSPATVLAEPHPFYNSANAHCRKGS